MNASTPHAIEELSIHADAGEVRRVSVWLETVGLKHGIPAAHIGRLDLCIHEALANVIAHGGAIALTSPVCLHFDTHRNAGTGEVALTISDSGTAFDPLAARSKIRPQTLAEAKPGGLGLAMMRSNADDLIYCNREGRNRLTFVVRWTERAKDNLK
jgi:anti-sigma regulatory factor (Ser/Thr protein kinase)